jgi:hypothetical protein
MKYRSWLPLLPESASMYILGASSPNMQCPMSNETFKSQCFRSSETLEAIGYPQKSGLFPD